MASVGFVRDLIRPDTGHGAHRVTYVELFFDLVFVFAITQLSHILLHQQTGLDLLHTVMLAAAVWWVWVFTTWAANWLNPETGWVRGLLIVLMLLGMLLSSAIPEAFGDKAALFAFSLVLMQLTRSVFTFLAFARDHPEHAVNFIRITVWHVLPGVFWIAGALAPEQARLWLWLVALLIDYLGPRIRFWTPGLGPSPLSTWNVSGEHMAERVSLFLIIVLGESIIVTGTAFAEHPLDGEHVLAFLAAFAGTVLLWLLYFNHGERGGSEFISNAPERGMIAQTAYTYIPLLMILGVVLAAVADGLILEHPSGAAGLWLAWLACAASAVYLLGNLLFRRAVGGRWLYGNLAGIVVLVGLAVAGPLLSALALSWLVNVVLFGVVVAEEVVWRREAGRAA
ncbi:low temperature requirement protein A [Leifsonia poae]|uniref:low temperature requirement protein A n=1 Tax=Leifsonia poae TaxID=110933 RepID=UPI001CC07A63|nr:low temperature requirement protein A [Leifsonia poae]